MNDQLSAASWLKRLLTLALISLTVWGGVKLFDPHAFPIRYVSVTGDYRHLKPTEAQRLLKEALYSRSFFSVSVNKIRSQLEKVPWVGRAEIRRVWPDTLAIRIEERQFVARWGAHSLLSKDGEVITFSRETLPPISPVFWGEPLQAVNILAQYHSFSEKLKLLGLMISDIVLDARQSWRVKLTNGMTIELGRNGFDKRFNRFINFYRQYLSKQEGKVASVDMRYTNGASVSWKSV